VGKPQKHVKTERLRPRGILGKGERRPKSKGVQSKIRREKDSKTTEEEGISINNSIE